MELMGYYALFALSISLAATYLWFWPLLQQAKVQGIQNAFTGYPILSTIIYVLVSTIVAPILVFPMFSSVMADRFKHGLETEMLKADSKI